MYNTDEQVKAYFDNDVELAEIVKLTSDEQQVFDDYCKCIKKWNGIKHEPRAYARVVVTGGKVSGHEYLLECFGCYGLEVPKRDIYIAENFFVVFDRNELVFRRKDGSVYPFRAT